MKWHNSIKSNPWQRLLLTLSLGVVASLQSADGSGAQPLTLAQRKALLAQQQAQDKTKVGKPAAGARVGKLATAQSISPTTVAADPTTVVPAPIVTLTAASGSSPETVVAAAAPAAGAVKARAAELAAKATSQGGVPMPGQKLATCEGAGCRAAAFEKLQAQAVAEQQQAAEQAAAGNTADTESDAGAAVPTRELVTQLSGPQLLAQQAGQAVAAQARTQHGGAAVPAVEVTAEQLLAGRPVGEREAERVAALAVEQAAAKELADLAAAEAVRLEQEKAARLAAEAALRQTQLQEAALLAEQQRLAAAQPAAVPKFDYDNFVAAGIALPPMTEEDWAELAAKKPASPVVEDTGWLARARRTAGSWLGY